MSERSPRTDLGILQDAKLADIAQQLRDMNGNDPEGDHLIADSLLCDAILLLAGKEGKEIVDAFKEVDRWYA